jgi:hypothetical protein
MDVLGRDFIRLKVLKARNEKIKFSGNPAPAGRQLGAGRQTPHAQPQARLN